MFENLSKAHPCKSRLPWLPPILRLAVIVFADTSEFSDVDAPNHRFRCIAERCVSPRSAKSGFDALTTSHGVEWLLHHSSRHTWQFPSGSSSHLVSAGCRGRGRLPRCYATATAAKLQMNRGQSRCLGAGRVGSFDFVLADEVKFPPLFGLVVDCSDLLEVLDGDAGAGFVLNKHVFPRFRVLFVIRAF